MTGIHFWSLVNIMRSAAQPKTTRDAILDATDRMLAKYGYKKMTIDDLAKEVGIGKGSVYLHFKSKEEIALSHIDRIIERLKQRLQTIAVSKGSVETRIRKMILGRIMYRFDSVQHYFQSLNELLSQLRPGLLERRRRYFEEEAKLFGVVLAEGKRSGVFRINNPIEVGRAITDATNALLPYSLSAFELGERSEVEKKARQVADLIMNGLVRR